MVKLKMWMSLLFIEEGGWSSLLDKNIKSYIYDTEKVIIEHNISSLIMQMVIYNFEEYLEYEELYINQRRIAKRYLRRSIQILKKNLPPGLTISTKYLSHLL